MKTRGGLIYSMLINVYRSMILFPSYVPSFTNIISKKRLFIVSLPIWIFSIYSGMWSMVYLYVLFNAMLLCIWLYSNWGFHDPIPWVWVPTKYEGQQPISCKAAWHNCSVQPPLSTPVVAGFFFVHMAFKQQHESPGASIMNQKSSDNLKCSKFPFEDRK